MTRLWAIVPAAGAGRRIASDVPKQYLMVAGAPILEHTLQRLLACADISGIVVAVDPHDHHVDGISSISDPRVSTTAGGAERADSVLAGLLALSSIAAPRDWVLVHDAARPCLPLKDLNQLIAEAREHDCGAILAQPIVDTIKQADDQGLVVTTLDRSQLWRAQTPQMFRLSELQTALKESLKRGDVITDEASAMERAGFPVRVVPGPVCNLKITIPEDLNLAEFYLQALSRTD
jgi:2-C-methyl-D-erythritol 4-phosphate cytidylyltransferase